MSNQPSAVVAEPTPDSTRAKVRRMVESAPFQRIVVALILINSVTLGLEVSPRMMADYGQTILTIGQVTVAAFVVELVLRIYAYGLQFFRGGWNLFDLFVVLIALIPGSGAYSVLRVLRVTRLLSTVRSMRRVVAALVATLPGMTSIAALLGMLLYIFSVMATQLFGQTHPDQFGSLTKSTLALFQVTTGDDWANVIRPVTDQHPWSWLFFILFIVLATYIVLNLFIAVAVEALDHQHEEETLGEIEESIEEALDETEDALLAELRRISARLEALEQKLP